MSEKVAGDFNPAKLRRDRMREAAGGKSKTARAQALRNGADLVRRGETATAPACAIDEGNKQDGVRARPEPVAEWELPVQDAILHDAFISYASQDRAVALVLVTYLRDRGARVCWDQDFDAGRRFDEEIVQAIALARAVIVIWSAVSARSRYVRDEANLALESGKLIATHVPGFDLTTPPLGFGSIHSVCIDDAGRLAKSLARLGITLA